MNYSNITINYTNYGMPEFSGCINPISCSDLQDIALFGMIDQISQHIIIGYGIFTLFVLVMITLYFKAPKYFDNKQFISSLYIMLTTLLLLSVMMFIYTKSLV